MNRNILLLSLVSFLNDLSSEVISAALPLFILQLGGGGYTAGFIGGLRELVASLLKLPAGYLSDRVGLRKPFVVAGYAVSAFFKLLIGVSKTPFHLVVFSSLERLGKGIRTAPRDAIISLSAGKSGESFGLHRAFDTAGALAGSLLALFLVKFFSVRETVIAGAVISLFALIPLLLVKEPEVKEQLKRGSIRLEAGFKRLTVAAFFFSLSSVTYLFFLMWIEEKTGSESLTILLYALYNLFYTLFSFPTGKLADRIGKSKVLVAGYLLFSFFSAGFLLSTSVFWFGFLFSIYGISSAITDGVQRAFVSDLTGEKVKGTAFGVFHAVSGVGALISNLVGGFLWNENPYYLFLFSAVLSVISAAVVFFVGRR
ncbi:MAG: MFS transporter [Desulfurobacteriaceae bacterium]